MVQLAVALIFPADVAREIDEVRERFGSARALAVFPHITPVYAFLPLAKTDVVIEKLKPLAEMTEPFVMVLDGFDHFGEDPAVAFIAVKDPKPVVELHSAIVSSLEHLRQGGSGFELTEFVPHVTLHDNVSRNDLQSLMSELANHGFRREIIVESFELFANEGEGWEVAHQFKLATT